MNTLRRLHMYLGCFFAPILLFFVCTGWYQTVNPDRRKGINDSDDLVSRLCRVHVEQHYPTPAASTYSPRWFRGFVVVMCLALIATTALGILLAFRFGRSRWAICLSLALGMVVPVVLLWLGQGH